RALHLAHVSAVGVLLAAKARGLVSLVRPILDDLRARAGFRLAEAVYQAALRAAGECCVRRLLCRHSLSVSLPPPEETGAIAALLLRPDVGADGERTRAGAGQDARPPRRAPTATVVASGSECQRDVAR